MTDKNKGIHIIAFILLVVGGLNWLILALFNWEIGEIFGGMDSIVSKIIYILIGLSALYEIFTHKESCTACDTDNSQQTPETPEAPKPEEPATPTM